MKPTSEININENAICHTSYLGVVKIYGDDAKDFVQGQFSNDIDLLTENNSQLNSYNSPKGRMYTSFRLFRQKDAYFMVLPQEIIAPIVKRLTMFVMRSKVTIVNLSDSWQCIGLSGPALQENVQNTPEEVDATSHENECTFIHMPGVAQRLLVVGPNEQIDKIIGTLKDYGVNTDSAHWQRLDIHAGLPNIYAGTQETFVAQMVNLPWVNGVSFTKGCYPGQEVVARMHYLGKLKKHMFRIVIASDTAPAAGENLYYGNSENAQSIGQIVDARVNDQGEVDALAVVQVSAMEKGDLHLENASGPAVRFEELPYSFEAPSQD